MQMYQKYLKNLPLLSLGAHQTQVCFVLKFVSHPCIHVNIPKSRTVQNKRLLSIWGWRYLVCTYKCPLPTAGNVCATEKAKVGNFRIQFWASLISEKRQIKREWAKYISGPSLRTLKHVIICEAQTCRKTVQEESWEENSEWLWENSKKARQEACDFSFFKSTQLFLGCASMPSQVPRRGGGLLQVAHYNWLLSFVKMPLWENMVLSHAACPCD